MELAFAGATAVGGGRIRAALDRTISKVSPDGPNSRAKGRAYVHVTFNGRPQFVSDKILRRGDGEMRLPSELQQAPWPAVGSGWRI